MTLRSVTYPFALIAAMVLAGCGSESSDVPETAGSEPASSEAGLSPEAIQALAETQKVCAVTDEPLGSMGEPVAVLVKDKQGEEHTVLLCCESCREELLDNPDKYLAKLDEQPESAP